MGLVSSLASAIGVSDTAQPVTCGISAFSQTTYQEIPESLQAFQYFPETITDTKAADWVQKNVPGGSHPILSFVNGGARTISFTAIFTQEENPEEMSFLSSLLTGKIELFKNSNRKDTEKNIAQAVAYLRSFTYPEYVNGVSSSPPFAIIYLPNSGITGTGDFKDSVCGAMMQCDVTYEKFHRNGAPRYIAVNLSFVEVVQTNPNWQYVDRQGMLNSLGGGYHREMIGAAPNKSSSPLSSVPKFGG